MATEFGTGKTVFILAIVVGCFAVLWPKIFYPMLQGSVEPKPTVVNTNEHLRQERPPHLRPEMLHPALREKGRAIPQSHIVPKVVEKEGRPPPVPGMRPPMGGAGHVVPAPKGGSTMGIIMPMYTIGIVIFFMYTMMKLLFKKSDESTAYKEFKPDPEFRRVVFNESDYYNNRTSHHPHKVEEESATKLGWKERDAKDIELDQLRKRLAETEAAMERIVKLVSIPPKSENNEKESESDVFEKEISSPEEAIKLAKQESDLKEDEISRKKRSIDEFNAEDIKSDVEENVIEQDGDVPISQRGIDDFKGDNLSGDELIKDSLLDEFERFSPTRSHGTSDDVVAKVGINDSGEEEDEEEKEEEDEDDEEEEDYEKDGVDKAAGSANDLELEDEEKKLEADEEEEDEEIESDEEVAVERKQNSVRQLVDVVNDDDEAEEEEEEEEEEEDEEEEEEDEDDDANLTNPTGVNSGSKDQHLNGVEKLDDDDDEDDEEEEEDDDDEDNDEEERNDRRFSGRHH